MGKGDARSVRAVTTRAGRIFVPRAGRPRPSRRSALAFGLAAVALALTIAGGAGISTARAAGNTITVCASGCDHTTIQGAVNAAASGDTISVAPGTYDGTDITITTPLTLSGQSGAVINVPNDAQVNGIDIEANDVTVTGFDIAGPATAPYTSYSWGSNISRGIRIVKNVTGFTISGNDIHDVRNGILVDGESNTGSITGNVIDNTKSGISVQYTDGSGITISGNSQGTDGNEWGVNLHLNGYWDGSTIHSNPYPGGTAPTSVQQALLANSAANHNWTVQDQAYTAANRTQVQVATTGSASAQGSLLTPIDTIQGGVDAVAAGGTVDVAAGDYAENVTITTPDLTLLGDPGTSGTAGPGPSAPSITCAVTIEAAGVTVSGFDIANPTGFYGIAVGDPTGGGTAPDNAVVSHNRVHKVNGTASGDGIRLITVEPSTGVDIKDNVVENGEPTNSGAASYTNTIAGIFLRSAGGAFTNTTVEDNVVQNITQNNATGNRSAMGIWVGGSAGSATVANLKVIGNTITGITSNLIARGFMINHAYNGTGTTTGLEVADNTISDITGAGAVRGIALETHTPSATITDNTISSLTDTSSAADVTGIAFVENPDAASVTLSGDTFDGKPMTSSSSDVFVDPAYSSLSTSGDTYPEVLAGDTYAYYGLNAFGTIQDGVNGAASGGTVNVAAGSYTENVSIQKPVSLAGPNASVDPVTDAGSRAAEATVTGKFAVYASNVSVKGFTFTNPSYSGSSIKGVHVYGAGPAAIGSITVSDNIFSDIQNADPKPYGSYGVMVQGVVDGVTVSDNKIDDIHSTGWAHGIEVTPTCSRVAAPQNVTVSGNSMSDIVGADGDSFGFTVDWCDSSNIADASQVSFHGNSLLGGVGVRNLDGAHTLDAGGNWWGSAAGPGTISGVDATPWCTDSGCTAMSNDADLASLSLSSGTLSPAFASATTAYTASVGHSVTSVTVSDTASTGATATTTGGSSLAVGDNTVKVTVTSADGTATKTYTVTVTRGASSDASLTGLSLSSGTLSPAFASGTTSYTASVGNDVSSITVTATPVSGATAAVSGGSSLAVGANTITVTVTAADDTTTTTYTVTVTRAAASGGGGGTTTTTTTTPTVTTANVPVSKTATPDSSGSVTVAVAPPPSTSGGPAPKPVTVAVAWTPKAFTEPVTITVTPVVPTSTQSTGTTTTPGTTTPGTTTPVPIAGGFKLGSTVVQVNITTSSGAQVTSFAAPLVIHISASEAGQVPAYSHDGTSWTTIPRLSSPSLPAGQPDGYYVNPDGSVDVYTRHATYYALLADAQAPTTPTLTARVTRKHLRLAIRGAHDNVAVTGYVVNRNRHGYRATKRPYLALPLKPGRYFVVAHDAAWNLSGHSKTITVVRTHDKKHPYAVTG